MNKSLDIRVSKVLSWIFLFILILLPFHEFLTTWIGSNFGHLDAWRIWKEIILLLTVPFAVYLVKRKATLRRWVHKDPIVLLIIAYTLINIVIGLWAYSAHRVNLAALSDGLIIDLRFLLFFVLVAVVSSYSNLLKDHWRLILICPAIIVIAFGILQLFLPYNFLQHFGYGPKTIPAYQTVDQKIQYQRIQSTLRGADPLGAYLVLIITALLVGIRRRLVLKTIILIVALTALFYTYSRSAWLGLTATVITLIYVVTTSPRLRRYYGFISAGLLVLALILVISFRNNQTAENIFFHTSKSSTNLSSNAARNSAEETGFKDMIHHPLGGGTGSAGPASAHNNHPAKIAENYFIQVGQESGLEGLVIFIAINILVAVRLWRQKSDPLAAVLLASLVGITLINLVSHAWADDTLSLIWWGLAGIALAPGIIKMNHKIIKHEKIKKTVTRVQTE